MNAAIFVIELIILYFLAKRVISSIHTFLFLLIPNRQVSFNLLTALLFPGTVIHELSHLIIAELLGVRTGKLTLVPQTHDGEIHVGSVMIAKSDPIRRYTIGLAPFFVGIVTLAGLSYILPTITSAVSHNLAQRQLFGRPDILYLIGIFYLFFVISNTMFSSRKDLEGFFPLLIFLITIGGLVYVSGFQIPLTEQMSGALETVMQTLVQSIAFVLALNISLLLIVRLVTILMEKILGRRVVHTGSSNTSSHRDR